MMLRLRGCVIAVLIFAASPASAQNSAGTERFDRVAKVGAGSELFVSNVRGETRITPGTSGQIEIHAVKRPSTRHPGDNESVANTTIDVSATANRVDVRVDTSRRNQSVADVDFDIRVPPDCSIDVRTVSGDLRVNAVNGSVRAQAVSGNVALEGTPGIAAAKTVSGSVTITRAGGDAATEIGTVSGDITLNGFKGRAVSFRTVSGKTQVADATADRIDFHSVSGGFDFTGTLSRGGRYDLESHSGHIRLAIAEQPGFEVGISTFSGPIAVDFSTRSEGPLQSRAGRREPMRGVYGDGSASLMVRTFSGGVTIKRR